MSLYKTIVRTPSDDAACPIPPKPDSETLELIRESIPVEELVMLFKFPANGTEGMTGGGRYTLAQKGTAHVLATIVALTSAGVLSTGVYYAMYYSGLINHLWPAYQTLESALAGCGTFRGATSRWLANKVTGAPNCAQVHAHFQEILDRVYNISIGAGGTGWLAIYASGGYHALHETILEFLFGNGRRCEVTFASKSPSRRSSSFRPKTPSSASAAGGGRRHRRQSYRNRRW